jgi:hypothetical protein
MRAKLGKGERTPAQEPLRAAVEAEKDREASRGRRRRRMALEAA